MPRATAVGLGPRSREGQGPVRSPRGWAPEAERGRAPCDRRGTGPQKPSGAGLKKVPTRTVPCCSPSTVTRHSQGLAPHQGLYFPTNK